MFQLDYDVSLEVWQYVLSFDEVKFRVSWDPDAPVGHCLTIFRKWGSGDECIRSIDLDASPPLDITLFETNLGNCTDCDTLFNAELQIRLTQ